jgi:FKBP-type peptidyl-prolyl cis-trans isomerase FklB
MSDYQFKDQLEEFSYSLGLTISSNLLQSGIKNVNARLFMAGFMDTFEGNIPRISMEQANQILQEYMLWQNKEEAQRNLDEGLSYLLNNVKIEGVVETQSGLQYKIIRNGNGPVPVRESMVKCHYHGVLLDGTVFDSSVESKQPVIFPVSGVIQGWAEALQMMQVGSKWRLFIPPDLAYGEQGIGGMIGPNATLIFDVELLEIV